MPSTKKKFKKTDPISERARVLSDQIASLETEIKKLDAQIQRAPAPPRLRSTAVPHGATVTHNTSEQPASVRASYEEVFEEVKSLRTAEETATPDQFNELGVRKYDLPGLLNRMRRLFQRPTTSNPRLVAYLAAGGVQGLRPLRYEKRVARNRFIFFAAGLFLLLLGLILVFFRNH
jgi:hypothetical protein